MVGSSAVGEAFGTDGSARLNLLKIRCPCPKSIRSALWITSWIPREI